MIDVRDISKKFGRNVVLDGLSLEIGRGELFVLLGANGAGKTTLLKCLAGLYLPYAGTITIDGHDRRHDHLAIRRFTAWLADRPQVHWMFSGRGWLEMVADLYGVDEATRDRQVAELLDVFDLTEMADRRIVGYSNGQTKKLALCATLVTNARLYFMDEPFTGEIDPPGLAAFKEILDEMRRGPGSAPAASWRASREAGSGGETVDPVSAGRGASRRRDLRRRPSADPLLCLRGHSGHRRGGRLVMAVLRRGTAVGLRVAA